MENWRRFMLLFIGFIESLIFSGIIFGWASLLFILQEEGIYSHLCGRDSSLSSDAFYQRNGEDDGYASELNDFNYTDHITGEPDVSTGGDEVVVRAVCALQSNEFTLIYTVAATMYGMTSIFIGFSLDHLGLWATRLVGSLLMVTGFFCLAFTTKQRSWLLWPAMNLVSLGSNQLKLSCYQFTNLWPKHRSTILFVYGSAFAISTAVFTLLQHLYTSGVPYKLLTLILALVSILTIPATFLMPLMKVTPFSDSRVTARTTNTDDDLRKEQGKELLPMGAEVGKEAKSVDDATNEDGYNIPLSHSLLTLSAALHFVWQFISLFMILFYTVSFNSWMRKATDDQDLVAHYTKVMGMCQLIGPLITPISGIFTDWRVKVANRYNDPVENARLTLQAPAFACAITTCFLAILMTCKMFVTKNAIYASMFIIAISRPMTHSCVASYVRLRFPEEHFNRMNGIFTTAVAVAMFVQYPICVWMFSSDDKFHVANWALMGSLVVSLLSPAHLMSKSISRMYAIRYLKDIKHKDFRDL